MNTLEQFDHQNKKQDKAHFTHLIQVALADGNVDETEKEMLHRLGKKMGFTDPEMDNLIESTKNAMFVPPYELYKRFEQVYDIVKMILADGKIENSEMRLATNLALKSGFNEKEIPGLLILLIDGIRKGEDEEDLFEVYKKKRVQQTT